MSNTQALRHVVAAANAGNATLAQVHLQKAAEQAPDDAGVWLWMAWFAQSPLSAVHCLETALADERYRALAEAGLAWARAMAQFKVIETGTVVVPESVISVTPAVSAAPVIAAPVIAEVAAPVVSIPEPVVAIAAEVDDVEVVVDAVEEVAVEEALAASVAEVAAEVTASVAPISVAPSAEAMPELVAVAPVATAEPEVEAEFEPAFAAAPASTATASSDENNWFTPTRGRTSGSSRASLWSGIGMGAADPEPTAPVKPVVQDPWSSPVAQEHVEETVPPVITAPAASRWEAEIPTVSAPVIAAPVIAPGIPSYNNDWASSSWTAPEPKPIVAPAVSYTPVEPEPAPSVWRGPQNDWFGETPSANPVVDTPTSVVTEPFQWTPPVSAPVVAPASTVSAVPNDTVTVTELRFEEPVVSHTSEDIEPEAADEVVESAYVEPVHAEPAFSEPTAERLDDTWRTPSATQTVEVVETTDVEVIPEAEVVPDPVAQPEPVTAKSGFERYASADRFEAATPAAAKTVLIVDDSPTVRKLVAMTLEKRGYRVVSAFDGVAAIKEIAAHNPSLILMDVNMPRLDGYQLCKLVKKHESTRHIPVLMLSGKDGMFDRLRGRLVGCCGYISKPFVPEELVEAVEKHLAAAVES